MIGLQGIYPKVIITQVAKDTKIFIGAFFQKTRDTPEGTGELNCGYEVHNEILCSC